MYKWSSWLGKFVFKGLKLQKFLNLEVFTVIGWLSTFASEYIKVYLDFTLGKKLHNCTLTIWSYTLSFLNVQVQ